MEYSYIITITELEKIIVVLLHYKKVAVNFKTYKYHFTVSKMGKIYKNGFKKWANGINPIPGGY